MLQNFRQSMAWLHTWFGLVLGFILMVAFFFGAMSVFDREIDRWAIPATRFEPQPMPSFDKLLQPVFADMQPLEPARAAMSGMVNGPLAYAVYREQHVARRANGGQPCRLVSTKASCLNGSWPVRSTFAP